MSEPTTALEPILRLSKDLKDASKILSPSEARYLVDSYYQRQDARIRADAQVRIMTGEEPHEVISWLAENERRLESQIRRALDAYGDADPLGRWAKSVKGIGPVIAAGLLAHLEFELNRCLKCDRGVPMNAEKCPHKQCEGTKFHSERIRTASPFWSFAGQDPSVRWEKKTKRPWNARLKTLCWKIGESFVKVKGYEDAFYGQHYARRKAMEEARNVEGHYSKNAVTKLEEVRIGKTTDAYRWYSGQIGTQAALHYLKQKALKVVVTSKQLADMTPEGEGVQMLPPAHIQSISKRWTVKLFLAHYHNVGYRLKFGEDAPAPYPIAMLGHANIIDPPGME